MCSVFFLKKKMKRVHMVFFFLLLRYLYKFMQRMYMRRIKDIGQRVCLEKSEVQGWEG